jgi:hypothetical protein
MNRTLSLLNGCFIVAMAAALSLAQEAPPAVPTAPEASAKATPADGHVIHVTAPHLWTGKGDRLLFQRHTVPRANDFSVLRWSVICLPAELASSLSFAEIRLKQSSASPFGAIGLCGLLKQSLRWCRFPEFRSTTR